MANTVLSIEALVNASMAKVWESWNDPKHVQIWNTAVPEWHCPKAENDFKVGGKFSYTMAAKDGSFSFDFWGTYTEIIENERIAYTLGDDRKVEIDFKQTENGIHLVEKFEAENQNPIEMQQAGWQSILNNFKSYTETL